MASKGKAPDAEFDVRGVVGLPTTTFDVEVLDAEVIQEKGAEIVLPDYDLLEDFPWVRGLSYSQLRFLSLYDGDNHKAVGKELGVTPSCVCAWLRCPRMRYALQKRAEWEVPPKIVADRTERQAMWTQVMRDQRMPMAERIKASVCLGQVQGDFNQRRIEGEMEGAPTTYIIETGIERAPNQKLVTEEDLDGV